MKIAEITAITYKLLITQCTNLYNISVEPLTIFLTGATLAEEALNVYLYFLA